MGEIFTDKEYKERKNELIREKIRVESQINSTSHHEGNWIDDAEKAFKFATNARHWFANGTKEMKTSILVALGLNPVLENKILRLDLQKPFSVIKEGAILYRRSKSTIEPKKRLIGQSIRHYKTNGVMDGARTRDIRLHKPALYQLSYHHHKEVWRPVEDSNP